MNHAPDYNGYYNQYNNNYFKNAQDSNLQPNYTNITQEGYDTNNIYTNQSFTIQNNNANQHHFLPNQQNTEKPHTPYYKNGLKNFQNSNSDTIRKDNDVIFSYQENENPKIVTTVAISEQKNELKSKKEDIEITEQKEGDSKMEIKVQNEMDKLSS